MRDLHSDSFEDTDLRYACPSCRRIFARPPADWACPTCKETLRIFGALRLRDRRRGSTEEEDGGDDALVYEEEEPEDGYESAEDSEDLE